MTVMFRKSGPNMFLISKVVIFCYCFNFLYYVIYEVFCYDLLLAAIFNNLNVWVLYLNDVNIFYFKLSFKGLKDITNISLRQF